MKRSAGIRATAIVVSCLLGSAIAQVDAQKNLDVCNSFCAVSKNGCQRDVARSALPAFSVGLALNFLNPVAARIGGNSNDLAGMTQVPTLRKSDNSTGFEQAYQQCESDRLQCVRDCVHAEAKPETPR